MLQSNSALVSYKYIRYLLDRFEAKGKCAAEPSLSSDSKFGFLFVKKKYFYRILLDTYSACLASGSAFPKAFSNY